MMVHLTPLLRRAFLLVDQNMLLKIQLGPGAGPPDRAVLTSGIGFRQPTPWPGWVSRLTPDRFQGRSTS